jgi:hypothetical protein
MVYKPAAIGCATCSGPTIAATIDAGPCDAAGCDIATGVVASAVDKGYTATRTGNSIDVILEAPEKSHRTGSQRIAKRLKMN